MLGWVMKLEAVSMKEACLSQAYYLSPLFKNLITARPSIMLAAEFPKNLLLGFTVPSIRM
jgi:hypothetical protein